MIHIPGGVFGNLDVLELARIPLPKAALKVFELAFLLCVPQTFRRR
jgi:hypothetical protein